MRTTVETVCGPIPITSLGKTLTHEHLIIDTNRVYALSYGADKMSDEKITLENRAEVMRNLHSIVFGYKDNIVFDNIDDMANELLAFKAIGGKTLFEVSTCDLGRDPLALRAISEKTGIQIVMGGTYYYYPSIDEKTKELMQGDHGINRLADQMIREFFDGVGDTGIKPGVLGELGLQFDGPTNHILLHAAMIAQRETGAPLIIHSAPYEALDAAEEEGADLTKIVLGHWTMECPVDEAIRRGAWVSFDQFGMNFPGIIGDDQRILDVLAMFERGYEDRLLISMDTCWKIRLKKYGGNGYDDLFVNVIPKLHEAGITEEQINHLLCDNPMKLLM